MLTDATILIAEGLKGNGSGKVNAAVKLFQRQLSKPHWGFAHHDAVVEYIFKAIRVHSIIPKCGGCYGMI